jgi:UDP-3-O-[3-hydroxymyristoyl] glucosamine N-acyltransferase
VPANLASFPKPLIRTPNPYLAYAKVQAFFQPKPLTPRGVDSRAFIGGGVKIGRDVSIYPFVHVGAGSEIGDRAVLYPGVYLGESVQVGEESFFTPMW